MATAILRKITEKNDYEDLDDSETKKSRFKVSFVKRSGDDIEKSYLVGESKDSVAKGNDNLDLFEEEIKERPHISTFVQALERYSSVSVRADDAIIDGQPNKSSSKMGTLMGVYLPCVQNILGVILFIRLTWIVGMAGILSSLGIVVLCCCTTLLTAISMSAVATNGVVPAGGSYFMISRALGPELGGAVGVLFYLGTTFASTLYILGAVEILITYIAPGMRLFGDIDGPENKANLLNNFRIYGTVCLALMATLVFFGVKYVNRLASIFLACVVISILSIFIGVFSTAISPPDQQLCMLGDRLIKTVYNQECSKGNSTNPSDIRKVFCEKNITANNETFPDDECDNFFQANSLYQIPGIPGLSSNASELNLYPKYAEVNEILTKSNVSSVAVVESDPETFKPSNDYPSWLTADVTSSFTILLAIFFPSVTGIMAGSNRSGDLKDAQRSIPKGTIGAVLTTATIYILSVVFFGSCVDGILLRDKFGDSIGGELIVSLLAWPNKWVVLIGAFLSTVGAGLQSLVGAPRLLQAIAKDGIIPNLKFFAKGKKNGDPTWALLLTAFISFSGIMIADLDSVAPIITMFFLMCYAFVNVACALQTLLNTPGWRPTFKYYHWVLSLIGMSLCVALMFISSWIYTIVAFLLAASIHKYIEYSGAKQEWGDGLRGLQLTTARYALLRLEEGEQHTKNWRPQFLVLMKANEDLKPKHPRMLDLVEQLKAGKGLTIVTTVLSGNPIQIYPEANKCQQETKESLNESKLKGFARCIVCENVNAGISSVIQGSGLGGLRHNSIMVGWPYKWRSKPDGAGYTTFLETLKIASALNQAVIVPKNIMHFPVKGERLQGTIDVWWIVHDGGLLMLLPWLLRQHKVWKQCKIRIFTVAQLEDNSIQLKKDLANFLYKLRIEAEIEVVEMQTSDISAYTYERTLLMEQRTEILSQLKQANTTSLFTSVSEGGITNNEMTWMPNSNNVSASYSISEKLKLNLEKTEELQSTKNDESGIDLNNIKPKSTNVRRMHTAVKLNETIVNRSHTAQLVILNLPGPPKKSERNREANYMEFLEVLTEGLSRVMMVRGGGREVITMYS